MYQVRTAEAYMSMTNEEQINELKIWIEDTLDSHRSHIRSISGTLPEQNEDLAAVIDAPFKQLAVMINDYDEDSAAHLVLKYRLANNIEKCDDTILDTDEFGELSCKLAREFADEENEIKELDDLKSYNDDLQTFCRIFGLEALLKSLRAWYPE